MKLIDLQLIVVTRKPSQTDWSFTLSCAASDPASLLSESTAFPFMFFVHFGVSLSSLLPLKLRCHPFPRLSSRFFSLVASLRVRGFHQSPSGFPARLSLCLKFSYSAYTLCLSDARFFFLFHLKIIKDVRVGAQSVFCSGVSPKYFWLFLIREK